MSPGSVSENSLKESEPCVFEGLSTCRRIIKIRATTYCRLSIVTDIFDSLVREFILELEQRSEGDDDTLGRFVGPRGIIHSSIFKIDARTSPKNIPPPNPHILPWYLMLQIKSSLTFGTPLNGGTSICESASPAANPAGMVQ